VHNVESILIKELASVVDRFPTEFPTGVLKSSARSQQDVRERGTRPRRGAW